MVPGTLSLYDLRAFGDVSFPGQSTPAIVCVVALPTPFTRLPQMAPQLTTHRLIPPDVLVDGLVTHAPFHQSESANDPDDLFRRPLFTEKPAYDREVLLTVMQVAPGSSSPGDGSAMGPGIAVAIIDAITPVPSQLPSNGTAVSVHLPGDLRRIKTLL